MTRVATTGTATIGTVAAMIGIMAVGTVRTAIATNTAAMETTAGMIGTRETDTTRLDVAAATLAVAVDTSAARIAGKIY